MASFKMTLAVREDLKPWVDFYAGLSGSNATAYINEAIARDMEAASPEIKAAFEAFMAARSSAMATRADGGAAD